MRALGKIGVTFAVSVFCVIFFGENGAFAQGLSARGNVNVMDHGAAGDGVTDDTAAVQAALDSGAANQRVTYFPCGVYAVTQPLEVSSVVRMDDCAIIRAMAPMNAVIEVGSAGYVRDGWFRGGVIDANDVAGDGLILRQYAHFHVVDTEVLNARAYGFHLGDASLPGTSYEAILSGVHTRRTIGSRQAGSAGLYVDKNSSDNNVTNSVFVGFDVGVRTMTGGNFFTDIHVWSPLSVGWMTVGFDDYGSGNFWKGCEADTVLLVGLAAHAYNTMIEGCRFFNNNLYGQDSLVTGIAFDQPSPFATVMGTVFMGQDSTHQMALDIQVSVPASLKLFGNQYVNVVQHF